MRRESGGVAACIYIVYTLYDMYMYIYKSVRVDLELISLKTQARLAIPQDVVRIRSRT